MPVGDFSLKLGRGAESVRPKRTVVRAHKLPVPLLRQTFSAFRASRGASELIAQIPSLGELSRWNEVASFRVCGKSGTALYLDLWDCDHFDGFTDIPRSAKDCRAWFSEKGFSTWGSAETATGRVNCFFRAPSTGTYQCNAQLESYPSSSGSRVECLIDNFSFGSLPFTGLINQPHVSNLTAGYHHFRIRQQSGGFFFHNLTVYRVV
jgi:hypothetical protein